MRHFLAVLLLCFAASAPVNAATVTINAAFTSTVGGNDIDVDTSTDYGTRTVTSSVNGSSSVTYIDWQTTNSGALFNFDFAHVRTGQANSIAQTDSTIFFTVDEDATYSLSGLYTAISPPNNTSSYVYLRDVGSAFYLFADESVSLHTANESFVLGAEGDGDLSNGFQGSLVGQLIAGTQYEFRFNNYILQEQLDDLGAAATGCITLSINGSAGDCTTTSAPVPLPAAAWLLLSGLAGLGIVGRRKARG